jgi:anti-sigma B factor antagonist
LVAKYIPHYASAVRIPFWLHNILKPIGKFTMKLDYSELENGIRFIKLEGRLDLNGTYSIEVQFVNRCAGDGVRVLVDLSGVSYVSSVGIPMLVNTAKSVISRGGKMAFLNPQENVMKVLDLVGIPNLIPIYNDPQTALAELK